MNPLYFLYLYNDVYPMLKYLFAVKFWKDRRHANIEFIHSYSLIIMPWRFSYACVIVINKRTVCFVVICFRGHLRYLQCSFIEDKYGN